MSSKKRTEWGYIEKTINRIDDAKSKTFLNALTKFEAFL